ncbi:Glycosyl hydrolases family 28 [Microdochium nivale]|nr:Glycosyl hydrolases family 28 [Microdochium nivale]
MVLTNSILGLCAATLLPLAINAAPAKAAKASAADSCTFTTAAAAKSGKASCSTITLSNIAVPAGQTLDMTGLKAGTHVIFSGTTTFGYTQWEGPLISFSGDNINIEGASGHLIDGGGAQWWDTKGSNPGGKTKPKFFFAHSLKDSNIRNLNVKNTPVQAFSINDVTNLGVYGINIDNSAGDTQGGHNTDAFDVGSSTGVYISGATVRNQDDCLAINSGTNITFTGGFCSGGHGLSIGSVGGRTDNTVRNVKILDSKIVNSENGVRIKTVSGTTGSVSDITYSGITLSGITNYGIVIEQDYENGKPTGTPTGGVPITGLTLTGITGTVEAGGSNVYILCAKDACSGWKWSGVSVSGGKKKVTCEGIPSGSGASC